MCLAGPRQMGCHSRGVGRGRFAVVHGRSRHPVLYLCAAPVGVNQADWDVEIFHEMATKEITHRREAGDTLRRAMIPVDVGIILGLSSNGVGHPAQTDQRMVGAGDFLLGIVGATDRPCHVGLAGAEPHLTNERSHFLARLGGMGD